jgi:Icc-related predicted phosphoesterase
MLIGFVGDVHGRVFHMLAALATWQRQTGRRFDLIVQVGDMGAYPNPEQTDAATRSYMALDQTEGDFARLLWPDDVTARHLTLLQREIPSPVHFIHGNHDDVGWLRSLPPESRADPFGFLRYVPDGRVLEFSGTRVGFLGGEDRPGAAADIDDHALDELAGLGPGSIDILVTHEAPHGLAVGRDGRLQGSRRISDLLIRLQPRFHVAGHYHHLNGPRREAATTSLALSSLAASARWKPNAVGLQPGCLAALDMEARQLTPVVDPWLSTFPTPFDFGLWCDAPS